MQRKHYNDGTISCIYEYKKVYGKHTKVGFADFTVTLILQDLLIVGGTGKYNNNNLYIVLRVHDSVTKYMFVLHCLFILHICARVIFMSDIQ